jgi:hypothetical protein
LPQANRFGFATGTVARKLKWKRADSKTQFSNPVDTRSENFAIDYANNVVPISNAVAYREKNLIN